MLKPFTQVLHALKRTSLELRSAQADGRERRAKAREAQRLAQEETARNAARLKPRKSFSFYQALPAPSGGGGGEGGEGEGGEPQPQKVRTCLFDEVTISDEHAITKMWGRARARSPSRRRCVWGGRARGGGRAGGWAGGRALGRVPVVACSA